MSGAPRSGSGRRACRGPAAAITGRAPSRSPLPPSRRLPRSPGATPAAAPAACSSCTPLRRRQRQAYAAARARARPASWSPGRPPRPRATCLGWSQWRRLSAFESVTAVGTRAPPSRRSDASAAAPGPPNVPQTHACTHAHARAHARAHACVRALRGAALHTAIHKQRQSAAAPRARAPRRFWRPSECRGVPPASLVWIPLALRPARRRLFSTAAAPRKQVPSPRTNKCTACRPDSLVAHPHPATHNRWPGPIAHPQRGPLGAVSARPGPLPRLRHKRTGPQPVCQACKRAPAHSLRPPLPDAIH